MVDRHVYSGQSIQSAVNASSSGDSIYIHAGTYVEQVIVSNKSGLMIQPYQNDAVIVDGDYSWVWNGVFNIRQASSNIRVTGLEIKNSMYTTNNQSMGVLIDSQTNDVHDIRIDHCNIHHHASCGIHSYHGTNIEFDHNLVDYVHASLPNSNEAISFSGVNGFDIHHNTMTRFGKEGLDVKSGSNNGFVHHNYIDNSNAPQEYSHCCVYLDGYSSTLTNIDVFNNYFTGDWGPGILMGPEKDTGYHENIRVFNNIVHIKSKSGDQYRAFDCSTQPGNAHHWNGVYIYNNTFYSEGDNQIFRVIPYITRVSNLVIENNIITGTNGTVLYFQLMTPATALIPGKVTLTNNLFHRYGGTAHNQWTSQTDPTNGWGFNYYVLDPLLMNRVAGDFHLQPASPAINHGIVVDLDFDYDDHPRPSGDYDIGAYEYGSLPQNIDDAVNFTVEVQ